MFNVLFSRIIVKNCVNSSLREFNLWGLCYSPTKNRIMSFYAVARGRCPGIFLNWGDCEAQVKGFSGAKYKKFTSTTDAEAFINEHKANGENPPGKLAKNKSLKRPIAAVTNTPKIPAKTKRRTKVTKESDSEDDISEILNKQMDKLEKDIKKSEKTINKIIDKGVVKQKKAIMIDHPEPKRKAKVASNQFEIDDLGFVQVYTDGACSSNGKKGAKAGLGVYWGDGHPMNISQPVSGRATNNCGEIQASTQAINIALQNNIKQLQVNTDSKFLINAVTKWMFGWKRNGWKLKDGSPVKNELDFRELDLVQKKLIVKWNYVEAHKGIHGNEMADQLARLGATMYKS